MNRYKIVKINSFGWIGLFSTSIYYKNIFLLHWKFIHTKLHPATEFGFTILGFVLPIIQKGRCLFGINFYSWNERPAAYLSISLFYFPSLDFRIGNGKSWFWIRNENFYSLKIRRQNIPPF